MSKMKPTERYKCNCPRKTMIVMDDSILTLIAYFDWVSSTGYEGDRSECWECYCKKVRA